MPFKSSRASLPFLLKQIERVGLTLRPSIRMLLNFAALQGVSILDILQRPMEAASRPLLKQWAEQSLLPLDMGQFRYQGVELVKLCRCLLRLGSVTFIPPLEFVLKDLRISRENFMDHRVHLYREYHSHYENQGGGAELNRQSDIFKSALKHLVDQPNLRGRALRWRLSGLVSQSLNKTRDEVTVACDSALAYSRLARRAKDRLGVKVHRTGGKPAYKAVRSSEEHIQSVLTF